MENEIDEQRDEAVVDQVENDGVEEGQKKSFPPGNRILQIVIVIFFVGNNCCNFMVCFSKVPTICT